MSQKIANHEVLTRYRDALLARFPDQLQRLILFGSFGKAEKPPVRLTQVAF